VWLLREHDLRCLEIAPLNQPPERGGTEANHCGRHVISTRTGISFLTGIVRSVGGSILKSDSVAGIIPEMRHRCGVSSDVASAIDFLDTSRDYSRVRPSRNNHTAQASFLAPAGKFMR